MKSRAIPNTDERELRRYRQFYMVYPAAASLIAASNAEFGPAWACLRAVPDVGAKGNRYIRGEKRISPNKSGLYKKSF